MPHLPIERLAELVDGGATPSEREHLAKCVTCTREFEAYRRLVAMASDERRTIAPPLTEWGSLAVRLRAEGMVAADGVPNKRRSVGAVEGLRRAAAVVVLLGGGAVLGRMSAGMPVADAVAFRTPVDVQSALDPVSGGGQFVTNTSTGFTSSQAALDVLEQAQRQYELAATYLASHDTTSSEQAPEQYRTRLAALDRTAETMQQAMRDAPTDPYINQYYLATLSAREQTLRRLGTTLPVGNRLGRF